MDPVFLSIEDIMLIHGRVIARDGGPAGVRDIGLLSSAAMMPQQTSGGGYVHEDLAAMAAAYLYHLTRNHALFDGNKRVGLASALVFLIANGVDRLPDEDQSAEMTLAVAEGRATKDQVATWFRKAIGR